MSTVRSEAARPVPGPPSTSGNPDQAAEPARCVADLVAGLDGLDDRPVREHVAVFERVHQVLTDALSAIDGV